MPSTSPNTASSRLVRDHRLTDLDTEIWAREPSRRLRHTIDSRGLMVGGCSCRRCCIRRLDDYREGYNFRMARHRLPRRAAPANSKRDLILECFTKSQTDWTLREICDKTGATYLTVRKHVNELLADGVVVKAGVTKGGPRRGRPATLYILAQ